MSNEIKVVYQDAGGYRFTGNLKKTADGWSLTHEGNSKTYSELPFCIEEHHAAGGYVGFVGFDIPDDASQKRIEGGIIVDGKFLPWPVKPESSNKRLPNESSFQQLQRIAANRDEQSRKVRERERRQILEKANQHDPRKVQQARNINNLIAGQRRPKRTGE